MNHSKQFRCAENKILAAGWDSLRQHADVHVDWRLCPALYQKLQRVGYLAYRILC